LEKNEDFESKKWKEIRFWYCGGNGQIGFLITLNQPRRKLKNISEQGMNFKGFGSINFDSISHFLSHHAFHRLDNY